MPGCAKLLFQHGPSGFYRRTACIQFPMRQAGQLHRHDRKTLALATLALLTLAAIQGLPLHAQDAPQGPIAPPPEHHVTRIANESAPPAPPSLPEAEIIRRFAQKEDEYIRSGSRYTYRKTIRIQEFAADGQPSGEFVVVTQPGRDVDGKPFEKVVEKPRSTLQHLFLRTEDLDGLQRIPAFPLSSGQLAKYDLKYLGKEQVDEIDCYIFQAKPKVVERQKTYRENVDGKYWFPSYSRSDGTLNQKGVQTPVRIVIKWTDFKSIPGPAPPLAPAASTTSSKP